LATYHAPIWKNSTRLFVCGWAYRIVKKPFTAIATGVFALIALLHIFRLAFGWEVTFQGGVIPLWVSGLGVVIAGGLAIMLWRESR
jgi:hypothetical protein